MAHATAATILIVDDNPINLTLLGELLRPDYRVRAATSGERALSLLASAPLPDLMLLDVMMPGTSGYDVLRAMRADAQLREVPVIFTTALAEAEDEQLGLDLGAVDYLCKPLRPASVLARVRTHLELARARRRLEGVNAALERELARRTQHAQLVQDVTIRALARLAETRDNETGNHILRTQEIVRALALRAAAHPPYADQLDATAIALIAKSAPLHDIGKVGIPDRILLKPGPLTADERRVMNEHARLGAEALERAEGDTRHRLPFLKYAKQIALHHHERWDGSGYPDGLAGSAIPLAARVMAVADVFDALVSARVYKPALSHAHARELMARERGRHFDPDLLDLFLADFDFFCDLASRYPDAAAPAEHVSSTPVEHA